MRKSKKSNPMMELTRLRNGYLRVPCILSYPNLHRAVKQKSSDDMKYSMAAIIPKDIDISELEDQIEEQIKEKWGKNRPRKLTELIRDGSEYEGQEGYGDDVVFFNARNTRRPFVRDMMGDDITDPEETYPGCRGLLVFDTYPYDMEGNRGVGASLQGFIKVAEGDRLGGAAPMDPDEAMEDLSEEFDPDEFTF